MRERRFERFAVIWMRSGSQIVQDSRARKLQTAALLLAANLLGTFLTSIVLPLWQGFFLFQLGFHVFALPSSGHTYILTQNARKNGPQIDLISPWYAVS